jgi:hypothetical protein
MGTAGDVIPPPRASSPMQRRRHGNSTSFPTGYLLLSTFAPIVATAVSTREVLTSQAARPHLPGFQAPFADLQDTGGSRDDQASVIANDRRSLSLLLQFYNDPDFGYSPCRSRIEQREPGPASFPFFHQHQQVWRKT